MLKKILLSSCVLGMTLAYAIDAKTYVVNKNDATEDISMGVSASATREISKVTCDDEIKFSKNDKYMIIESSEFGMAPVTLLVLDNNEKELSKITLEQADTYKFKVELKKLPNIKIVKVINRFDDLQYCKKISYK